MEILNVKDWINQEQSLENYFNDIVNAITVAMIKCPKVKNWLIIVHKSMEEIVRNRFPEFYVLGTYLMGNNIYYFKIIEYDSTVTEYKFNVTEYKFNVTGFNK